MHHDDDGFELGPLRHLEAASTNWLLTFDSRGFVATVQAEYSYYSDKGLSLPRVFINVGLDPLLQKIQHAACSLRLVKMSPMHLSSHLLTWKGRQAALYRRWGPNDFSFWPWLSRPLSALAGSVRCSCLRSTAPSSLVCDSRHQHFVFESVVYYCDAPVDADECWLSLSDFMPIHYLDYQVSIPGRWRLHLPASKII